MVIGTKPHKEAAKRKNPIIQDQKAEMSRNRKAMEHLPRQKAQTTLPK